MSPRLNLTKANVHLQNSVMCVRACVCVVHLYCSTQLSMFDMEKCYRNKIIIIIIIIITSQATCTHAFVALSFMDQIQREVPLMITEKNAYRQLSVCNTSLVICTRTAHLV